MLDSDGGTAMLSRVASGFLAALASAAAAHGQAAAEYAARSTGSAISASGGDAAIGGCVVGSTLLTCLSRSYPKTTIVVIGLLVVMIFRWVNRAYRARS